MFISRTKQGKAIRAVAQNMEVAKLVGINIKKVFMMSMAISALLAGFAAVLFSPVYVVSPNSWSILFSSFPVIVLGGLGSIKGSFVASFVLAFVEKIIEFTVGGGYLVSTVTFTIMLAVLFIRPSGLFGKRIRE
jgi:branched-chain amino acid transport system permease protein